MHCWFCVAQELCQFSLGLNLFCSYSLKNNFFRMNDFLDQTKREVEKGIDQVTAKANEMKAHIAEKASEAKDAVMERAGDVKDATMKKVEEGRDYVKQNPEKSAGIALGVGAFLGAIVDFLTGRKK